MKRILTAILAVSVFIGCTTETNLPRQGNQVVVRSDENQLLTRVTVLSDGIIKVESTPDSAFTEDESLVDITGLPEVDFTTAENEDEVTVSTVSLTVKINRADGRVSFYKPDGSQIVAEAEDGRQFTAREVEGTSGYALMQKFNTPENEALYGLGQHQAHEMNYKGKSEELFQYNTKVSVPVIVSTQNYGILWDNYSLSRFGDPRPYENLEALDLFDADGNPGGLTATYLNKDNNEVTVKRTESIVDYENLETISRFPDNVNFNNALITWEGDISSETPGLYHFLCYYAGYTKVWVDGELQFYHWRTAWNPSVAKFDVELAQGEKRHIKMEWVPDGGTSYIGLKVHTPTDIYNPDDVTFSSEMGNEMRYYFLYDDSMDGVISQYRKLTGKAQVMPKWSMGFWQSRERYKTQEELLDVLSEFRERKIPLDNIVLDWSYWPVDKWGSHEFDLDRFPDASGMIDQVHEANAQIMVSVWPKFYITTDHYKEFNDNGWMYKQAAEDSIRDWIYPGYIGSFYDAYHPDARQLFWEQIREHLYTKGFDAWWLDATEPDILSNASIEYRKDLMDPTALGPAEQYFNAYALMNAKGIYDGQREENPDERVFILTRSGFAGIQRYGAVTWSGDIGTRWEDMEAQITAGLNFAMAGLPYWTMDIGGFCVEKRYENAQEGSKDMEEWRELNARWYQFGAFAPLFRVHGQYPFREIWNIAPEGHPAYSSMLKYNKLRYRLMPYIYSLAGWTHHKDYTIMRGLAMDFSDDENTWEVGDQFMFGPSLLINPVTEYKARERQVYLPAGIGWYSGLSGEYLEGGQTIEADAPYESMPVFVKEGSILPTGPEIEFVTQKPADPITLVIFSGADGTFDIYEDDGTSYGYEKGEFSTIPLSWDDAGSTLTIGEREGAFEGMLDERTFRVVVASPENPVTLEELPETGEEVLYNGQAITVSF